MSIDHIAALTLLQAAVDVPEVVMTAQRGFSEAGRGVVYVDMRRDDVYSCGYLTAQSIKKVLPDDNRRKPLLSLIDSYEPLKEAGVAILLPSEENKVGMTLCLLKFESIAESAP